MQKLIIPNKIHVGFQEREGTYTGKLAYVIYTDSKGKKRKEPSWNSWRDRKIDPEDFNNEPTSGFVLNKGVGGQRESWGWNARNEYIRIFDPRGFEFEISVANLLFILTECDAFKGKGLDGEFVYAWDKADLILLPVGCFEYKASSEFTSLQTKKVTKKDMKEGATYKHKNTSILVYLGRHKVRDLESYWYYDGGNPYESSPIKFKHVFYDVDKQDYHFEKGFTKLAEVLDEDCHPEFAHLYAEFVDSKYVSEFKGITMSKIDIKKIPVSHCGYYNMFFTKEGSSYQLLKLGNRRPKRYKISPSRLHHGLREEYPAPEGMSDEYFWPETPAMFDSIDLTTLLRQRNVIASFSSPSPDILASASYLKDKELYTPEIEFESGTKVEVPYYVKRQQD